MRRLAFRHAERRFWFGRGDMAEELTDIAGLVRPLAGYSACMYLSEGDTIGLLSIMGNYLINFYTMFPLYDTEYSFLNDSGAAALFHAFRHSGLSTVTSQLRAPVA